MYVGEDEGKGWGKIKRVKKKEKGRGIGRVTRGRFWWVGGWGVKGEDRFKEW